jgi:riboflavin synthase
MFTGIIEEVGRVTSITNEKDNRRLTVSASHLVKELKKGDSIAVSGVCLTAVEITPKSFGADLAEETWNVTSFSRIQRGALVNLELPMRADGRFGGHIVQGHVDGTGSVTAIRADGLARVLEVRLEPRLARYLVEKGSVALDGVSLTVSALTEHGFEVSLIPETLERTNLGAIGEGAVLNIEVDILAKQVERLMEARA